MGLGISSVGNNGSGDLPISDVFPTSQFGNFALHIELPYRFFMLRNVKSLRDLAKVLNISYSGLTYLLYRKGVNNCYHTFYIPKKNGELRTISAPLDQLKQIQRNLAKLLNSAREKMFGELRIISNISHGFEKGKSIITNAKVHRNKRFILNVDIKDYFDSFHFGRVRGYFHKNKFFELNIDVATAIAQLVCFNGKLPQGAPTSPVVSNLISQILDVRLLSLVKKYRLKYTRYADDLTFSTNDKRFCTNIDIFLDELRKTIEESGFSVNEKKVRLQYKDSKQKVTGLVVNSVVNVDTDYYRLTKSMAHALYTKQEFHVNGLPGRINQLDGRFAFIDQIDSYNRRITGQKRTLYTLNAREKQFQRFLFFKHFLYGDKPLIITEGKTDVLHLKAALRNRCDEYPALVKKKSDGTFEYMIRFFRRTKRMNEYFGIAEDGADTLVNIYRLYHGGVINSNAIRSYNDIFNRYGYVSKYPTVILLDNELGDKNKEKPLHKFVKSIKLDDTELKEKDLTKLCKSSNLYLAVPPLLEGKESCEIEDLYDENTLNIRIAGKRFSRKKDKEDDKSYGKTCFASYIFNNYSEISFDKYTKLLNNINELVLLYEKDHIKMVQDDSVVIGE